MKQTLIDCLLVVLFFGWNSILGDEPTPKLPDPLPLRRILLPPDQVSAELERARQGIWVQLSREEFEARIQRAAQALDSVKNPPRLAEARYRATFEGSALVGTAQWKILRPGSSGGILPLQPLTLALRKVRMQKAQTDSTDAILGELDGKNLGLLVEQPGESSVFLDWSARGEMGAGGLRFDFQVPPCLIASLEIQLPADRSVLVDPDRPSLVSGPHPAESPDQRTWRIDFANRSQLRFVVRKTASGASAEPVILAQLHTRQDIGPDIIKAEYQLNLETSKNPVSELLFECDPVLQPYEIEVNQLKSWELRPADKPELPRTLAIQLREPFAGGPLVIRCVAPIYADKPWTCPTVRLPKAVDRGETLMIRIPPEIQLENWRSGHYRFTKNDTEEAGKYVLSLVRGAIPPGGATQRPSAQLKTRSADVRCRLQTWWQIGITADATQLIAQMQFEVVRGRVFQFPVLLPNGWKIDQVKMLPADGLHHWQLIQEKSHSLLMVHLQNSSRVGNSDRSSPKTVQLTIQMQPEKTLLNTRSPNWLMFPKVIPLHAFIAEAVLGITLDPNFDLEVKTTAGPAVADDKGPWGRHSLDAVWTSLGQPIEGSLRIRSRRIQVHARCDTEAVIASDHAVVLSRLTLQPLSGNPDSIDVSLSAPHPGPVTWRIQRGANQIKEVKRLATGKTALGIGIMGMRNPYIAAGLVLAPPPEYDIFRISLAQPLKELLLLEATMDLADENRTRDQTAEVGNRKAEVRGQRSEVGPLTFDLRRLTSDASRPTARRWQVPLPVVLHVASMDGEVALFVGKMELLEVERTGLTEGADLSRTHTAVPRRAFRYGAQPIGLVVTTRAPAENRSPEAQLATAHLTSFVDPDGRLFHQYRLQISNWRQRTFPVRLPNGARLLAARIDGRWLTYSHLESLNSEPEMVVLPVTSGRAVHRFEIIYSISVSSWKIWTRVEPPSRASPASTSNCPWEPDLPVKPVAFCHTWKLPPGVIPLFLDQYRPIRGGSADAAGVANAKWQDLLRPRFFLSPAQNADGGTGLRNRFLEVVPATLRKLEDSGSDAGGAGKLGDLLDQIVSDEFQSQEHLIIDGGALNDAGIRPATAVVRSQLDDKSNPLEHLGLVLIPCRSSLLLSTSRQKDVWESISLRRDSLPPTVASAVDRAVLHGHDASYQFLDLVSWLTAEAGGQRVEGGGQTSEAGGPSPALAARFGSLPDHSGSLTLDSEKDWGEWEVLASQAPGTAFVAIRQDFLRTLSVSIAVILLLAVWPLRHVASRWRLGMLFLALCFSGVALLWLPSPLQSLAWWPMGVCILLAALWYGKAVVLAAIPTRAVSATIMTSAMIALWAGDQKAEVRGGRSEVGDQKSATRGLASDFRPLTSDSKTPEAMPVVIVRGPKDAPEKQTVLVPPDLLEQLQTTAQNSTPDPRTAVVMAANYQGKVSGAGVEMVGDFQVHCPGDDSALVTIPLASVQIKDALCDGAPAQLRHFTRETPPQSAEGYTLEVKGRGGHTVSLRFHVAVTEKGQEREMKLNIPESVQSRLTLEVPPEAVNLHPLSFRGAWNVNGGAWGVGREATETTPQASRPAAHDSSLHSAVLKVDLGRTDTLHVRWQESTGSQTPPALYVREGYLWEITPASNTLSAVLQYSIAKGSLSKLKIHLPEEMVVRNIGVSRLPGDLAEDRPPRLQDWRVSGTGVDRQLELDFYQPVSGGVQVMLELVPMRVFAGSVVLPLPVPLNTRSAEGEDKQSLLAYRVLGSENHVDGHQRITGIDDSAFADFWRSVRMGDPGRELHAYRFRRSPGSPPFLRLKLQSLPGTPQGVQHLTWTVDKHRANCSLAAKLTSPDGSLMLAEWEIPKGVTLGEVSGPDVRNWSVAGNRLQVWLHKPVEAATIFLTGWTTVEEIKPPKNSVPSKVANNFQFRLQPIRLIGTPAPITYVHITSAQDLIMKTERITHLLPLPDTRAGSESLDFFSVKDDFSGTFTAREGGIGFPARLLTLAEVIDRQWTFQTNIECNIPPGERRTVRIQLRNWDSEDVRLEAPGANSRFEASRPGSGHTWVVAVPPSLSSSHEWKITGRKPLKSGGELQMPDISLEGANPQERWVAIAGKNVRGEDPRGLQTVTTPLPAMATWPEQAEKIRKSGSVWKLLTPDWHLRPVPVPATGSPAPMQVLLTEQTAAVVDGRHWVHQATYWLFYEAALDLNITLPANTRMLTATLDGTAIPHLQPEPGRLWLPLAGAAGAHFLRLQWVLDEEPTRFLRPRLESLKIESIPDPPTLWTIYVPAGYEIYSPTSASNTMPAAEHDMRRAEAQLQFSALLADRISGGAGESFKGQLFTAQEQFYRLLRTAKHRSVGYPGLDARRKELQERNIRLAAANLFEAIRVQAERQVLEHPGVPESIPGNEPLLAAQESILQHGGSPVYWDSSVQSPGPTVHLVSVAEEQRTRAMIYSGLLVVFLVAGWFLSFSPRVISVVRFSWPEQLFLVAIVAWVVLGSNWISLFLGIIGITGRIIIAGGWVLRVLDRGNVATPGQGSAMQAS